MYRFTQIRLNLFSTIIWKKNLIYFNLETMVKNGSTPPPIVEETPNGGVAVTKQLKQTFVQEFELHKIS